MYVALSPSVSVHLSTTPSIYSEMFFKSILVAALTIAETLSMNLLKPSKFMEEEGLPDSIERIEQIAQDADEKFGAASKKIMRRVTKARLSHRRPTLVPQPAVLASTDDEYEDVE